MKNTFLAVTRRAFSYLSVMLAVRQVGLALLLVLLSMLWLNIPDSSGLQIVLTVVLALVILALSGIGEAWILLRLTRRAESRSALLRGALIVLLAFLIWLGWSSLIDHLRVHDGLRAGYFNSKAPHALRNFLSYEHIYAWFGWMWTTLEWIGSGVLAAFAFAGVVAEQPLAYARRILGKPAFWIWLIVVTALTTLVANALVSWTPGHGLSLETISLVLRLSVVILVEGFAVCYLLGLLAACGETTEATAEAGTPVESQLRTDPTP